MKYLKKRDGKIQIAKGDLGGKMVTYTFEKEDDRVETKKNLKAFG